jgi:hypothetical protein
MIFDRGEKPMENKWVKLLVGIAIGYVGVYLLLTLLGIISIFFIYT